MEQEIDMNDLDLVMDANESLDEVITTLDDAVEQLKVMYEKKFIDKTTFVLLTETIVNTIDFVASVEIL